MDMKDASTLVRNVAKGRWFVLFICFLIISLAGGTYIFGIYSEVIKTVLGYDQETLTTLGFFKDLGGNVGIIAGLINEIAPPWVVLGIGAVMNIIGYLMIWLSVTQRIAKPKTWQMYLYICIGANSHTFANTGAVVTCVKNFPQSRGSVLGILKGFIGLSGAIFTQIYHAMNGHDERGLILLLGVLPSAVSLLVMLIVRPTKAITEKNEVRRFYSFLYIALALAGFLMVMIVVENKVKNFPQSGYQGIAVLIMLFLLSNLAVVVKAEMELQNWFPNGSLPTVFKCTGCLLGAQCTGHLCGDVTHHSVCRCTGCLRGDPSSPVLDDKKANVQEKQQQAELADMASTSKEHHEHLLQNWFPNMKLQNWFPNGSLPTVCRCSCTGCLRGDPSSPDLDDKKANVQEKQQQAELADMASTSKEHHEQHKSLRSRLIKMFKGPARGNDFTILQAFASMDMIILFSAATCGIGATLTAIDNMGQIGRSLGYTPVNISTFVSLISIWSFLGRVAAGFLSEFLLLKYKFPRPLMLTLALLIGCIGHIFIAFALPGSLYIASIAIGLSFGAQWPVLLAIISELFGLKYYATLYNFGAAASPVGSYLLSVKVAGALYDKEARKQSLLQAAHAPSSAHNILTCTGHECFRLSFIIMTLVSLFGVLISGILVVRTRKFYRSDIYSKFRVEPSLCQENVFEEHCP